MNRIRGLVFCLMVMPAAVVAEWSEAQQDVIAFLELAPQTYSYGDLDRYMALYDPELESWYMTSDKVNSFEDVRAAVQNSLERGLSIDDFRVTPISIEIEGDHAYVRYVEEELGSLEDGSWARYLFAATLRKTSGHWRFYRISFIEDPGGN